MGSLKYTLFYKQHFFPTQCQCCKQRFFRTKMLLMCCLIHVAIITLRHISYLVYSCPCLGLALFRLYLYDLIFIFSLIFIVINHITYSCPCLGLALFRLYLYDLIFIFSLIFIVINHITSFKQSYWFFEHFLEYLPLFLDDNVNKESK